MRNFFLIGFYALEKGEKKEGEGERGEDQGKRVSLYLWFDVKANQGLFCINCWNITFGCPISI